MHEKKRKEKKIKRLQMKEDFKDPDKKRNTGRPKHRRGEEGRRSL